MRAWRGPIIAYIAMLLPISSPAIASANLVQASCDINKDYVGIWFEGIDAIGTTKISEYSVNFTSPYITMNFAPGAYVLPWEWVEAISFQRSHRWDDAGRLNLRVRRPTGVRTEQIGVVQQSCWNAVRDYVRRTHPKLRISDSAAER